HFVHRPHRITLEPRTQPARGGVEYPILAIAEQRKLLARVAEVILVVAAGSNRVQRLEGPLRTAAEQPDHPDLGELLLEPRQQRLGEQLVQHGVVALERGPHVDVLAQRGDPVLDQVALSTTALARLGDSVLREPCGVRLESGGKSLQLAIGLARTLDETIDQLRQREVEHDAGGERRQQSTLVGAMVKQRRRVAALGTALATAIA